ncbi:MAG TPA: nickel pincer cofactor biosynthesis protein LarC [Vicinamibacterales bacterium]
MKTLYLDCFSGASGDMLLGALIDAGVPLDEVRRALGSLALSPETIWTEHVTRAGVRATKFCVRGEEAQVHAAAGVHGHSRSDLRSDSRSDLHSHEHSHTHDHADHHVHQHGDAHHHDHGQVAHGHRTLPEIAALIDRSALSSAGRDRAKQLFVRLGEAEAAIHGTSLERVHLHEVGALDSIIDIVGTVFALEQLQVERVVSSPLNVGSGSIRSAHGLYPVPAPATLRLLTGAPVYSGPQQAEMVTPTGALLVTAYAQAYGSVPAMRVSAIGYGAGTRDLRDMPNVLRVIIGESDAAAAHQTVVVLEAEIDDMNPQIFGVLMEKVLAQGALDLFYTPIQMKKGRPGMLVTIIAPPERRDALTALIFRETTTIGVRYREMARECLDRETITVETPLGSVRFKIARRNGEVLNASPEFDDCVRLAAEHDVPAKHVQALATQAYLDAKNRGL